VKTVIRFVWDRLSREVEIKLTFMKAEMFRKAVGLKCVGEEEGCIRAKTNLAVNVRV